jgi:hypothetical protein
MNARDGIEASKIFLRDTAAKHFLCMSYEASRDGLPYDRGQYFASCFVVVVEAVWILVTAGHVINDIRKAVDAGVSVHDFNLHDKLAGHSYRFPVPYDFDLNDWAVIESDGADYAAAVLSEMIVRNLDAGGIRPIGENAWGSEPFDQYPVWLLAGIPDESLAVVDERTVLKLTLMPLKPTTAPAMANDAPGTKVYAKLISQPGLDSVTIHDIEGMSGGPVFGLRAGAERFHYWLIGVQSTWYDVSRIACFCPLPRFLAAIKGAIQRARAGPLP